MAKDVKILWGRMSDKTWREFELKIAKHLNEGWTVIGFTSSCDQEHGDTVYVMLQHE